MVRHFILALTVSLYSLLGWASTAFEATVDRNKVSEGDTVILTVRYAANVFSDSPNFRPLTQDFRIVNQQRKSSFQFINGKSENWTVWTLSLSPKRKGKLQIPPLKFEGEVTKPIWIEVAEMSQRIQNQQDDVFFDTQVDVSKAYVQGQILYTEKLFFAVPLDNGQLNELAVDEAVVTPLGEIKQYNTRVNGRNFNVYERQFAIFPQTSGEMVIPGPRYTGEISNGPWRPGRPISLGHPPKKIEVLPKPSSYPNAPWIPAKNFSVSANWQGDPQQIKIGDPITLTINIEAKGLSSAQIPAVAIPELDGFKYYPDQAQTQDQDTASGLISSRKQSIAVVATKPGQFRLPEIRIPWWNTQTNRVEYATIDAQALTVETKASPAQRTQNSTEAIQAPLAVNAQKALLPPETVRENEWSPWMLSTLLFAILWLATILYIVWQRDRKSTLVTAESTAADTSKPLKALKKACRENQPDMARHALLNWANTTLPHAPYGRLTDICKDLNDKALISAIQELDYTLYSATGNSAWQGEYLWQLVNQYKPMAQSSQNQDNGLKPLYPTS
ncbi:protein BatD [Bermanella marisrubri]|uniref:DUF7939 domain-containing protein n=1 Tax=Bermanella marisrubri TaxID=207949 RepID=Q1N640_9GAMM|nr:BatD family protein [Bermanella marisrubri]EAT13752.1 hypothetical protein RED65_10179 [Oceanobacter sp. RED65] [Bermanella marisrubri]QIZ84526.1 protein BatD [Bermanella marisrubri]